MTGLPELNEAALEEAAKAICPHEAAWIEYEQRYRDDSRVAVQTYLASGGSGEAPAGLTESESCQRCGKPYDYVWWCHDPSLWAKVSGNDEGAGVLCIPCFDKLARDHACWLEWAPLNLRHLERHPRCAALRGPVGGEAGQEGGAADG